MISTDFEYRKRKYIYDCFIFDFIGCNPGGHRIFAGEQSGTSWGGGAFSGNGTGCRPSR